jgi:hypothetical protein
MVNLAVGDVFLLKEGDNVFFTGRTSHSDDVTISDKDAGRYVAYKTTYDGGGTGHGMHDIYPDGHHVWCEELDAVKPRRFNFYQSGCFRNMLPDIKPVGRARKMWVFIGDDFVRS